VRKARLPNFMRSCGREWSVDEVEAEHSLERHLLTLTDWTVSVQICRAATVVDGVDDAAQLVLYSVVSCLSASRHCMVLAFGRLSLLMS